MQKRTIKQAVFDLLDREGDLGPTEIARRLEITVGCAQGDKHRWKKARGYRVGTWQYSYVGLQRIPAGENGHVPPKSKEIPRGPRLVDVNVPSAKKVAPAEVSKIMRSRPMRNQVKLKKAGVEDEVRYYYLRFGQGAENVPDGYLGVATICLVPFGGVICRGIAFCSPPDQFKKRLGRNIALGRAIKAFCNACSSERIPEGTSAGVLKYRFMDFLSTYSPKLTNYEQRLMEC